MAQDHVTRTGSVVVSQLERRFGDRVVLDSIDLELQPAEFVAVLGKSGSGKSTLLRALAGIDHGSHGGGRVTVPAATSMVFQDSRLLPWASVLDNVALGLRGRGARASARTAIAEVGLGGREAAWPNELSGGEQQRVSLARALVREPELLLADEPFGALDALTRISMHELLRELCRRHQPTVVLVTHDVDEAIKLADRVLVIGDGAIVTDRRIADVGDLSSPSYVQIRGELLAALGVEG